MADIKVLDADSRQANWVAKTVQARKSLYYTRDKLLHGLRRQRFLRTKNKTARAYQRYVGQGIHCALGYRLVQTVVGAIAKAPPKWHVIAPDDEVASRVQRWIPLAFQNIERITKQRLFWRGLSRLAGDGILVAKFSRRAWSDFPLQQLGETDGDYNDRVRLWLRTSATVPFRIRLVDGLTFYPPTGEWDADFTVESSKRASAPTLRELRLAPTTKTGGLSNLAFFPADRPYPELELPNLPDNIQVDELWTPQECFIRVAGKVVVIPNEYGEIPYEWCYGEEGTDDPSLEGVSVMFPIMYLEPWIDQVLSVLAAWSSTVQPTPVTTTALGPGVNPNVETAVEDFKLGKHYTLKPGQALGWMGAPDVGPAVAFLQQLTNLADRAGMAPTPPWIGTRTPGTALSAAQEAVFAKLKPLEDNFSVFMSESAKRLIRWVDKVIGRPVYVSGLEMTSDQTKKQKSQVVLYPEDSGKISDVVCEITHAGVQDIIAMGNFGAFMVREGLWSPRRAMLVSGVEDPKKEREDLAEDMAFRHPAVQAYLAQKATEGEPVLEEALAGEAAPLGVTPGPMPRGRVKGVPRQPGGFRGAPRG